MSTSTWSPPLPNGWNYQPPAPKVQPLKTRASTLTTRVSTIRGTNDDQARLKVQMIRERVVQPALGAGPHGLAYTRQLLSEILGAFPKKSVNGYAQSAMAVRIFEWVKAHLRYVKDPAGRELFQQLPALVKGGIGDCDDFTAILAALFMAAGIKVRARIIKTQRGKGWAHIYPVAFLEGKWRAFDGALPQTLDHRAGKPGFEYPNPAQRLDLEVA